MFNCTSPAFYFLTFERVDCTIFTQLVGCLSSTSPLIFVLQMPNIFLLFLRRFYCPPHTSLLQMFSVFFPCSTKELFFFWNTKYYVVLWTKVFWPATVFVTSVSWVFSPRLHRLWRMSDRPPVLLCLVRSWEGTSPCVVRCKGVNIDNKSLFEVNHPTPSTTSI